VNTRSKLIRRIAAFALVAAACGPTTTTEFSLDLVENPASLGFSEEGLQSLDSAMANFVEAGRVAGLVTLLARHGKVAVFDTYGYDDVATKEPIAQDTIFRIYSMTKPVVGVAMMILFEEGKWTLDDPIPRRAPGTAWDPPSGPVRPAPGSGSIRPTISSSSAWSSVSGRVRTRVERTASFPPYRHDTWARPSLILNGRMWCPAARWNLARYCEWKVVAMSGCISERLDGESRGVIRP
jgi:hypothetical protein